MLTDQTATATALKGGVPLSDMIQMLRRELEKAQASSTASAIRFETEKVELELEVAVTNTAKGEAGVEFWVIKAGGELERSGVTTHTFRITLIPIIASTGER